MNKLNLSIVSNEGDSGAQVHLNVGFEDKAEAIAFHAEVAALCRKSGLDKTWRPGGIALLPKAFR